MISINSSEYQLCSQQRFSRWQVNRRGLSLIEVVASIALLALLMVSLLVGWQRHRKLAERSQKKLDAAERLDEQLGRWFAIDGGPPVNGQGTLTDTDFRWSSAPTPSRQPFPVGLVPITVKVSSPRYGKLLSIEVVVSSRALENGASAATVPLTTSDPSTTVNPSITVGANQ